MYGFGYGAGQLLKAFDGPAGDLALLLVTRGMASSPRGFCRMSAAGSRVVSCAPKITSAAIVALETQGASSALLSSRNLNSMRGATTLRSIFARHFECRIGMQEGGLCLDKLSKAGQVMDRAGLTKAGRALEKHGNRAGTVFPKATGNTVTKNLQGQFHLDDILTHPRSRQSQWKHRSFGDILDIQVPGQGGARFSQNGHFIGFLEPDVL